MKVFKKIDTNRNQYQEVMYKMYKDETKLSISVILVVVACTVYISIIGDSLTHTFTLSMIGFQILVYCKYLYDRRKKLLEQIEAFK
jgi:hypothetical protein